MKVLSCMDMEQRRRRRYMFVEKCTPKARRRRVGKRIGMRVLRWIFKVRVIGTSASQADFFASRACATSECAVTL